MTPPADSQPTMMWSTISSLRQLLRFNRGAVEVQEHGEFDHALIEDPSVEALQQELRGDMTDVACMRADGRQTWR